MSEFITLDEVMTISGASYTLEEQDRIEALIPLVSDVLRMEALKVGKDIDKMIEDNEAYSSVVKLVAADIVARALRLSTDSEPMTQESQSALGYTWSGTYAVPGGGVAGCIMRNDLKRLGLGVQRYGTIELWSRKHHER